ncbi:Hypothetical protein AA314_01391 [Archangium gephyra]|uniref:Uncharacterized protein n=1 Tax=Archangium gephyra TaxID=48 RepID=A0AAC8Q2D5_9BACT|nr:Hypothetical protein AA314_01391 [Archangium gephyra]
MEGASPFLGAPCPLGPQRKTAASPRREGARTARPGVRPRMNCAGCPGGTGGAVGTRLSMSHAHERRPSHDGGDNACNRGRSHPAAGSPPRAAGGL